MKNFVDKIGFPFIWIGICIAITIISLILQCKEDDPNRITQTVELLYVSTFDGALYVLKTEFNDSEIVDRGTEKEIDSLKCLRIIQAKEIIKKLENFNKPCK